MKNKGYYCYILYSFSINHRYVGYTTDLKKRLLEHKSNPTRTTTRANDYKLVWYAVFPTKKSNFI